MSGKLNWSSGGWLDISAKKGNRFVNYLIWITVRTGYTSLPPNRNGVPTDQMHWPPNSVSLHWILSSTVKISASLFPHFSKLIRLIFSHLQLINFILLFKKYLLNIICYVPNARNIKVSNTLDTSTPLALLQSNFDKDLKAILSF